MFTRRRVVLFLFLILILQLALRIPFLAEPLERDEGGYGYMGQRILAGEVPYRDAFDHKPPAVYFIYAFIVKCFGNTVAAVRGFTAFYALFTTLAVFGTGYLIFGAGGGLLSALLYALYSGTPMIQGSSANTETFMALPMCLALFCFILGGRKGDKRWMLAAGVLSGLAFMMKQVAALNFLALLFFSFKKMDNSEGKGWMDKYPILPLSIGFLVFPLIFIAYFWLNRALADFIKCAFLINRTYLAASPSPVFFIDPRYGLDSIFKIMASDNGPLWVLSIFAAILFLFGKKGKDRLLLVIWGILSFVGMASGSLFFGHYYIQLVPALCLLSAGMLLNWKEIKTPAVRVLAAAALLLLLCINLISLYPFYFFYTPNQISIQQYRTSDFVVSRVVANELAKLMRPGDRVFVWSAQPEIYFYLGQKAPSRYFYYIYWMKDPRPFGEFIPDAMLRGLMEESPRFIVRGNYSPPAPRLADWIMKNYNLRDELSGWKIGKMGWLIGERKR